MKNVILSVAFNMEIIDYKKAILIFLNYCWKVLVAVGTVFSVFGIILPELRQQWVLYIIVVILLVIFISLILLVINLIKREIADKTNICIPNQLLDIVSKLSKEESEILSGAIDRYFHLYGYHEERIKLGNLLNENRDIKNQVSNLIDQLGWANYLKNQTDGAITNIIQGVNLAKDNLLYYWAAKGERHLAGIERHRKNETAFLQHLNQSKEYTSKIQNVNEKTEMEGSIHLSEAKYLLEKKTDLAKAEEEANNAMGKFADDPRRQLKVYVVLGNIYLERKEWDKAYNTFKEGYDKSNGIRKDERAKNALGLAKIHLSVEVSRFFKIEKAKEYLREAESLKSSLKQHEINEIELLMKGLI